MLQLVEGPLWFTDWTMLRCKAKRQYHLISQVSRYCLWDGCWFTHRPRACDRRFHPIRPMKFDPLMLISSSKWYKKDLSAASGRSDLHHTPRQKTPPVGWFHPIWSMDKIWSQQSSTSIQYKNRQTDWKSCREGFVRSVVSEHLHPILILYYKQCDLIKTK